MNQIKEDDQCWCFRSKQAREHLFEHCSTWRSQQNAMWALVAKETKRRKRRWKMAELFADERYGGTILEFLLTRMWGWFRPPPPGWTRRARRRGRSQSVPRTTVGAIPGRRIWWQGRWGEGYSDHHQQLWAGGIQRGIEGHSGGARYSFSLFISLYVAAPHRELGRKPQLIRAGRNLKAVRFRRSLNRPYAK